MNNRGFSSESEVGDRYPAVEPRPSGEFSVFISYRHVEPDRTWAKWLHSALETYRVPRRLMQERGLPRRIGRVFRDEEELAASSDLGAGIRESLDHSEHLIVVCSPRTPSSQWIGAEVDYFRQRGRGDAILALLIEGEPSEAFPAALATIRPQAMRQLGPTEALETVEPLAADVRPDPSESSRYRKRMAKLRLLAAILHCRFDQLRQREQEFAVSGLAILTTIVLGLGVLAELNRERATAERNHALQSQSLLLTDFAHREIDQGNAVAGMLLALEALPRDVERPDRPVVPEAVDALYDGLLARRELAVLKVGSKIESASMSADGQRVLTVSKSGPAQLWDRTGAPVATLGNPGESVRFASFNPDSTRIVTGSAVGPPRIWDGKLGTLLLTLGTAPTTAAGFSPDGQRVLGSAKDVTWLWDAESGKEVAKIDGEAALPRTVANIAGGVSSPSSAFSADGSRLLTFDPRQASASLWNAASGERLATFQDALPLDHAALSANGSTVLTWSSGLSGVTSARIWPTASAVQYLLLHEPYLEAVLRPDGAQVVTFSVAGPSRLYDAKSGREISQLDYSSSAEFSPDLQRLVTVSGGRPAHLFDTATGAKIADLDAAGTVRFSPTAKRIVTSSGTLWDGVNGRQIAILRHDRTGRGAHTTGDTSSGLVDAAVFSEDGDRVITTGQDGAARIWNAADGAPIAALRAHTGPVTKATLSRDGATLLTVSDDKTVRLWDAHDGVEVAALRGHRGAIKKLAVARDGIHLVTVGNDGTVRLWDLKTDRQIAVLDGGGAAKLGDAALDTSGEYLVTSSSDGTARVWKTADGAAVTVLRGHDKSVSGASFSPDGTRVLTFGTDRTVRLWRMPSGEALAVLRHEGAIDSAQFCANGASIVTVARGRMAGHSQWDYIVQAYLWDAGSGQQIVGLDGPVSTIAVTQDSARVLVGYGNGAGRIWDCRDGTIIADLPQHENEVDQAEFTGDDQRLVTVARDRVGHLYAADLSREIAQFKHIADTRRAFVSRDGSRIMTLSDGPEPARIWDGVTGKRISSLEGHINFIDGGALSPAGDRALTFSGLDRTARLWDTDTGHQLALLPRDDHIDQVAFLPDGARVLLASRDGTIWIFPVYPSTAALLSHARAVVPRGLTPEERQRLGLAEPK
jgi:WD40 repeat protein